MDDCTEPVFNHQLLDNPHVQAKAPLCTHQNAVPQILPHKAEARQSTEAEPPDPAMDPTTHWQHYPLQRQTTTLAQDPYRYLVVHAGGLV